MTNKEQIKKVILEVAGDPETGIVVEFADRWAGAIVKLIVGEAEPDSGRDANKISQSSLTKETRIVGIEETR
jgi:hypothetical protein